MQKIKRKNIYLSIFFALILFSLVLLFFISPISREKRISPGFDHIDETKDKFIVISDTQHKGTLEFWREKNISKTRKLLLEIAERNPAFVAILGDLTTNGSSEKNWELFEDDYIPILDKQIPCFPVLGNHDYWGNNKKAIRNFFKRFPFMKKTWYSFTFKRIGFIMLNSNFKDLSKEEIQDQNQWFSNQMETFNNNGEIDFIIACCHHAPYTNSLVIEPSVEVRKNFAIPFQKYEKASLFLTGHCHSYEKFREGGKLFIVTGGGGGPRQKLQVDKKKRQFNDLFEGPAIRFFHFCEIESHEKGITLKVWKLKEDETFTIADQIEINGTNLLKRK